MYAIQARYRGRDKRRGHYVQRFAEALGHVGDAQCRVEGIDELAVLSSSPRTAADVIMVLVASHDWVVGVGISPSVGVADEEQAHDVARSALGRHGRVGSVSVRVDRPVSGLDREVGADISATFELLRFVAAKRSAEGQEATRLVRTGMSQQDAAAELGITKQAMSQRLQAAGWQAERTGFAMAVRLLARAHGEDSLDETMQG